MFQRKLFAIFLGTLVLSQLSAPLVNAQLLPYTDMQPASCVVYLNEYEADADKNKFLQTKMATEKKGLNELLACGIKTGRISLAMIPYFITYISNFLLGLVGLVCVLFIVIGGYQYVTGGLTEGGKDKGKKTISHALMGMSVAILSWVVVNIVITAVTS